MHIKVGSAETEIEIKDIKIRQKRFISPVLSATEANSNGGVFAKRLAAKKSRSAEQAQLADLANTRASHIEPFQAEGDTAARG